MKQFNFLAHASHYGFATLDSVAEVDRLMKERPHVIDSVQVIVHRQSSKSKQGIKENCQYRHLRLSNVPQNLSEAAIRNHFEDYGDIEGIWRSAEKDETWFIKYEE